MSEIRRTILCVLGAVAWAAAPAGAVEPLPSAVLVGVDESGAAINPPADWPAEAGPWNGKAARYNEATDALAFETFRADIRGASRLRATLDPSGTGAASHKFAPLVYEAGPVRPASMESDGTTVLYVSDGEGKGARCIGCADIVDGVDGAQIWKVAPSTDGTPAIPVRLEGARLHANQSKDHPAWTPDGKWLTAAVEMPVHAGIHRIGAGEIGMFTDIYAVSVDGKIWVQLTDWQATWSHADKVSPMPYQSDDPLCPTGRQYATAKRPEPYAGYHCSAAGAPPQTSGVMRPTLARTALANGNVALAWGSRVGLDLRYSWGGVQHLATAELAFAPSGLPAIVHMRNNLAPTPADPDGGGLWANPGGDTLIGAGYEPWDFTFDGTKLAFATDVFLSHKPGVTLDRLPEIDGKVYSQIYVDVAERSVDGMSLVDLTLYDPEGYAYPDQKTFAPIAKYGFFEEPTAYVELGPNAYAAIASSASADYDQTRYHKTFFLETWLFGSGSPRSARRITDFNAAAFTWTYPTSFDRRARRLYLTQVPAGQGGGNPPGKVLAIDLSAEH
ncbi:MAG: hypothetical protein H6923_03040 [Alphaproteobacteria bacterium]|nr:hypothetical protein [Alphaproteobacteria bacterium]